MDDETAAAASTTRVLRAAGRIGAEYFLRTFLEMSVATGGRPMHAVILMALGDANVAHLDGESEDQTYVALAAGDDSWRRPASVAAVAARLGLPYETARRTISALERDGLCARRGRGYVVTEDTFQQARFQATMAANVANLKRLVRRLQRQGVV